MIQERIVCNSNSETWKLTEAWSTSFVRIVFNENEDCVFAYMADHKSPWVGDGERYESFATARRAHGLPEFLTTPEVPRV